jgi:hypothetical protein
VNAALLGCGGERFGQRRADLDFKREVYGGNEKGKRSFAGDVAAMANERGGLISSHISFEIQRIALGDNESNSRPPSLPDP